MMATVHRSYRLEADLIDRVEAYAKAHGMRTSEAVTSLLEAGLSAPSETQEAAQKATTQEERTETHNDDSRAVIAVLRASNEDLRAEVSRLWAQMAEKDQQIRTAQGLADHAQQLHAAEVTRALPAEAGRRMSWWDRLTGRGKGE